MERPFETFVDRIIREAAERGEFEDLPGTGKPIPGAGTVDGEGWWIRQWVERNRQLDAASDVSAEPARRTESLFGCYGTGSG